MKQENPLVQEYAQLSTKTADALVGLKEAIKDMNDTNILHVQTLKENTQAINNIERFWGKIVFVLTVSIAILAGAEKVMKLFNIQ